LAIVSGTPTRGNIIFFAPCTFQSRFPLFSLIYFSLLVTCQVL
jgi:hypothetical protein